MGLSVVQQQLFEYFNHVNISSVKDTLEVFAEILTQSETNLPNNENELERQIDALNECYRKFDLEIMHGLDEVTAEKVMVLINTADNHVTQKAKFYDNSTIQLFSKIVQACVISEKGTVSTMDCINLNVIVNMTKTAAEAAISKLVADKWLSSNNGIIHLTSRSILELEQNIKKNYPDYAKTCPLCKTFLVQGATCSNCDCKVHFHCLKKYFTKITTQNKTCPSCKKEWIELRQDNRDDSDEEESTMQPEDDEDVTETSEDENAAEESEKPKKETSPPNGPTPVKRRRRN